MVTIVSILFKTLNIYIYINAREAQNGSQMLFKVINYQILILNSLNALLCGQVWTKLGSLLEEWRI